MLCTPAAAAPSCPPTVCLPARGAQVAVPLKPGQRQAKQQAGSAPDESAEEFPSLAEAAQVRRQREQRQRPAAAAKKLPAEGGGAALQAPQLLTWPGWQAEGAAAAAAPGAAAAAGRAAARPPAVAAAPAAARPGGPRAPLVVTVSRPRVQAGRGRAGRGGSRPHQQADASLAAGGPGAAAAAAVAAGTAAAEQATLLLGFEYESTQGQRLLLTPALLAAARASSLDSVSVRQHGAQPAAPGPATAAAAAAAAHAGPPAAAAFLLLHGMPLWLQLPADQLAALAGKRRPGAPSAPAGGAASWLQLRRLLIATPDAAVQLEAAPKLLLEVPRDMLAPSGGSTPASGDSPLPATLQLEYSLVEPLALPPASFCVLALPWLLTAPTALQSGPTGAAVAAAAAAAGAGGGGAGPAALIRQSGPLRAVLAGGSAVRPAAPA